MHKNKIIIKNIYKTKIKIFLNTDIKYISYPWTSLIKISLSYTTLFINKIQRTDKKKKKLFETL